MTGVDVDESRGRVTLSMLRRTDTMCARRLRCEYQGQKGNRTSTARFRVSNQLHEDARLAHVDLAVPTLERFRPLPDLGPEERRLYQTAARWYVAVFSDRAVRTADVDEWETAVPELGVRLSGRPGLALEDEQGRRELRILRLGGRRTDTSDGLDTAELRFAVTRLATWCAGEPLRVCVADVVTGGLSDITVDTDAVGPEARQWLRQRVADIESRAAEPVPRPGIECGHCRYVAGCSAHA